MRYFMMTADERSVYDPPAWDTIRPMEGRTNSIHESDVVVLVQTKHPEFRFNDRLHEAMHGRPWVLVCFTENGWDWDQKETHVWGKNTEKFFGASYNEHWKRFDEFVAEHPPILTFKRELLRKDVSERTLPIDYLAWMEDFGGQTKDDFLKRPLDVAYNWGRSSERRLNLHADIFRGATTMGYDILSEWAHVEPAIKDNPKSFKWLSVYTPHFCRIDVKEVQKYNRMAKVGIAMGGCGVKVFRHGEMCLDGIMAIERDNLAWAYPWTIGKNCLHADVKDIRDALMDTDRLYEIFCEAMENGRNYEPGAYLRRHVKPNIERCL